MFNPPLDIHCHHSKPLSLQGFSHCLRSFHFPVSGKSLDEMINAGENGFTLCIILKKRLHIANIQLFCRVSEVSSDSTYEEYGGIVQSSKRYTWILEEHPI